MYKENFLCEKNSYPVPLGNIGNSLYSRIYLWRTTLPAASSETQGHSVGSKVFKYGQKSPWVPTLTELFPKIQADTGSWLGTKNALYYCAQSANSFSRVLFVSSYTTADCFDHGLSGSCTKKCTQSGNFQFDIKPPSDFKILSSRKLKALVFQKYKLELTTGIQACIGHVLRKY